MTTFNSRIARIIKPLLIIIALAIIGGAGYLLLPHFFGQDETGLVASGTVEATDAQLGFQASGRVKSIQAREGDAVKAGTLLARLDTLETEARLRQARAQVNTITLRQQEAKRDRDRASTLLAGTAIGQEAYDKVLLAFNVAQSDHAQAVANVQALEAVLSNMAIHAPFDGIVTVRHRELGETITPGAPVFTLMNPNDCWVRIYVPENRIGQVRLGVKATITTDSFAGKSYTGEVVFIASEAEFTPKTVQTTEERVKLVYAVKVRVAGDTNFELKPGMPADVRLEVAVP